MAFIGNLKLTGQLNHLFVKLFKAPHVWLIWQGHTNSYKLTDQLTVRIERTANKNARV